MGTTKILNNNQSDSNFKKQLRSFGAAFLFLAYPFWFFTCLLALSISSCTVALPEFQTAKSLEAGKHSFAAGGFSGRGLNASTGGIAVHNYGITDQLDLTTGLSLSRLNIQQDNLKYSALIGPKWSTKSGNWALSIPAGAVVLNTFNDVNTGPTYVLTPTLYKSWGYDNPNLTYTFFFRSEGAYNEIRGTWLTAIGGYSQRIETDRLIHYISVSGSSSGPLYGLYFGYGLSLNRE